MVFGTNHTRRRTRTLAGMLALAWLAMPGALWADCTALDSHGLTRDCTALEEVGSCMVDARDSVNQCLERNTTSIFGWYRCQEDGLIDMAACAINSAFRTILK